MTVHVNIGDAKTRLSQLVAAALRGEDVVLAKAGEPQVRLVPVRELSDVARAERAARRKAAFGMFKHLVRDQDLDIRRVKQQDREYQSALTRKYGDPD